MVVYVLDRDFNTLGIIDDYTSIIWRPAYYDVGDFELYLSATAQVVNLLQKNRYIVRDKDITVDNDGNITYTNVMIIKKIALSTDSEDGDYMTVSGKELKYLLHQRIVWSQTVLTGTAENAIRQLVTANAITPADSKRIIPNLVLGAAAGLTDNIRKQVTGDHLDTAITEICKTYSYGWELFVYNKNLVFVIYKGVDRSYNQTERPYVVFSDDFENIINTEYELDSENYANTTLIGGEGEGLNRVYASVGDENSGLERYEVFTDARDISQNKENEDSITLEDYVELLQERGREKLAGAAVTEGFSGELLTGINFIYGVDYYQGDTVTVINKYGISKNVMVLSSIESTDGSGTKTIPQFNI